MTPVIYGTTPLARPLPRHLTTAGRAGPGSVITSHGPEERVAASISRSPRATLTSARSAGATPISMRKSTTASTSCPAGTDSAERALYDTIGTARCRWLSLVIRLIRCFGTKKP